MRETHHSTDGGWTAVSLYRSMDELDVLPHDRGELADPRRACPAAAPVRASGGVTTATAAPAQGAAPAGPARRAVPVAMSVTVSVVPIPLLVVTRARAAPRVDDPGG